MLNSSSSNSSSSFWKVISNLTLDSLQNDNPTLNPVDEVQRTETSDNQKELNSCRTELDDLKRRYKIIADELEAVKMSLHDKYISKEENQKLINKAIESEILATNKLNEIKAYLDIKFSNYLEFLGEDLTQLPSHHETIIDYVFSDLHSLRKEQTLNQSKCSSKCHKSEMK